MTETANSSYETIHRNTLQDPETFWLSEAGKIDWSTMPTKALEADPPFSRWFPDGMTNLCHNAVDRWAKSQPDAAALLFVSGETGEEKSYSYAQLLDEVNAWACLLRELEVGTGDRVLIYMPMIPEAVFAMLACARIGAIHAVVFGGFASGALAVRIDDAQPKVIVSADAGRRNGKVVPYRPLLEKALQQSAHHVPRVVMVDRGLTPFERNARDIDASPAIDMHRGTAIEPVALPATHPSYILYTSGTTGKPKGVQRDTGGYAVALRSSMDHIFRGRPGDTMLTASDIGWVVGHSYIVYGPLLAGMTTILFEGAPTYPDPGILWRIVSRHKVRLMFTSPTALRVLRKSGTEPMEGLDLSSLETLFVAGEPLDGGTTQWWNAQLGVELVDNYWQTETGWPILTLCRGLANLQAKLGSPGPAVYGYDVRVMDAETGSEVAPGEKGLLTLGLPLPPGTLSTLWRDDEKFKQTYFAAFAGNMRYSTFDWATRDENGYVTIIGRSDDIINVAGHRLGTREIEEVLNANELVGESAVVGVADPIKNEVPVAFVVLKDGRSSIDGLKAQLNEAVREVIGPLAALRDCYVVPALPKTRSGKIMRMLLKAICEGTEIGEVTMIEDPTVVGSIRDCVQQTAAE